MHNESQKPEQCKGQGRASMMKTAARIVSILTSLKLHLAMLKFSMSVNQPYYMANSVSRQDEPNPALWPAVHVFFWSGTPDNKSGFRCHHLGYLTSRGLVQRLVGVGGRAPPPLAHFSQLLPTPSGNISSPQSSTITKCKSCVQNTPAIWLATQVGKIALSYILGVTFPRFGVLYSI